jgi:hypothetical protein
MGNGRKIRGVLRQHVAYVNIKWNTCDINGNRLYRIVQRQHNCKTSTYKALNSTALLKVVGNEKEGGKKVANDGNWPQTAAIEVCLPY